MHVANDNLKPDQLARNRFKNAKEQLKQQSNNSTALKFKSFYQSPKKYQNVSNLCSIQSVSCRDNPFFSGIEAMPDIRPRKKSIPLVSELVLKVRSFKKIC